MSVFITAENLFKVKKAFEAYVEKNNILDSEFPCFNAYQWENKKNRPDHIIFSCGYRTVSLAQEFSEQSYYEPKIGNASENDIKWLGVSDASRVYIHK
jgi:hypothetical protein